MQTLHKRCAGLDVHKKEVVACLRLVARNKASHEVRRFPTTTRGLVELAEWLEEGMLEGRFALILANAAHVKGVPGRKSDTNDATWIADKPQRSKEGRNCRRRLDPHDGLSHAGRRRLLPRPRQRSLRSSRPRPRRAETRRPYPESRLPSRHQGRSIKQSGQDQFLDRRTHGRLRSLFCDGFDLRSGRCGDCWQYPARGRPA